MFQNCLSQPSVFNLLTFVILNQFFLNRMNKLTKYSLYKKKNNIGNIIKANEMKGREGAYCHPYTELTVIKSHDQDL